MSGSRNQLTLTAVCIVLLSLFPVAGYLTVILMLYHYHRSDRTAELIGVAKQDHGLLFLLAAFALSVLFSSQVLASMLNTAIFALQVLLYLIIRSDNDEEEQNFRLIRYLLVSSLAVSVIGIFQYYFISFMPAGWLDKSLYGAISGRAFSTLYNPNVLGSYLILIISIALAGFPCTGKSFNRFLQPLITVAALFCMLLTFSRGAWLGLAVSILIIFIFKKEKAYMLSLFAGAALLALPEYDAVIARTNMEFLAADTSGIFRLHLWDTAVKIFSDNPLWGAGIGSYGHLLQAQYGYYISHAHNFYLQMLAETGIIGLTAFLGYLCITMYVSYRLYRSSRSRRARSLALGTMAGFVGLLVHGSVDSTLYLPQLSIFIWLQMAVLRNVGDLELTPQPVFSFKLIPPLTRSLFVRYIVRGDNVMK